MEEDPGEEFEWKPPDLVSINGIRAGYKGAGVDIWQYQRQKDKRQKDKRQKEKSTKRQKDKKIKRQKGKKTKRQKDKKTKRQNTKRQKE